MYSSEPQPPRVLVVDDVASNLDLIAQALEPAGYEIYVARNGEEALRIASRAEPHLILLDVMMPGVDGLTVCKRIKADPALAAIPVIFVTALDDRDALRRGFEAGAVDYVVKPFFAEEVLLRVGTQVRLHQLNVELAARNAQLEASLAEVEMVNQRLAAERDKLVRTESALRTADNRLLTLNAREDRRWGLEGFVGRSPTIARIIQDLVKLKNNDTISVLITGESGTGKELIARAIHRNSGRASRPFVPVNCAAFPQDLAEAMFFGDRRSVSDGPTNDKQGFFELANGGTLFLDEVGSMPFEQQAKLLRVLEDGEVHPLGDSATLTTDVRVIAATNGDLSQAVSDGRFRADLYYRLARFRVQLPPLRERREDVPLLVQHFASQLAADMGIPRPDISERAWSLLAAYDFPGNIRELRNLLERALLLSAGEALTDEHFQLQPRLTPGGTHAGDAPIPLNLKQAERILMQRALDAAAGNISEAARLLGVHRTKLYRVFGRDS